MILAFWNNEHISEIFFPSPTTTNKQQFEREKRAIIQEWMDYTGMFYMYDVEKAGGFHRPMLYTLVKMIHVVKYKSPYTGKPYYTFNGYSSLIDAIGEKWNDIHRCDQLTQNKIKQYVWENYLNIPYKTHEYPK